jgi:hypothetical protein
MTNKNEQIPASHWPEAKCSACSVRCKYSHSVVNQRDIFQNDFNEEKSISRYYYTRDFLKSFELCENTVGFTPYDSCESRKHLFKEYFS